MELTRAQTYRLIVGIAGVMFAVSLGFILYASYSGHGIGNGYDELAFGTLSGLIAGFVIAALWLPDAGDLEKLFPHRRP